MFRRATAWVCSKMRSARVLFPWSMWAIMLKFRILSCGTANLHHLFFPEKSMKIQFFIIRVSIAQPGFLGKTRLRRAVPAACRHAVWQ